MMPDYNNRNSRGSSMLEQNLRLHYLEDWRNETAPVIKDILAVQAKQTANIANITRLFWLVFAVSIIKLIAGIFA
jgi:hypothetical protein